VDFAQGEVVSANVLLAAGEAFLGGSELVHEGEADVVLFGGEIDRGETAGKLLVGIPADLAAEAGSIARRFNIPQFGEEFEQDRPEEMPIFRAAGKECPKPKLGTLHFVNVDHGQIALAAGGDIEPETPFGFGLKGFEETFVDKLGDFVLAAVLRGGVELAELFEDLIVFEVNADDVVVVAAAFEQRPINDTIYGGAERVAHVSLLEDSFVASARAAIGEELLARDIGSASAVDGIYKAELDGVGESDFEIQIPRGGDG
jgi:hypothetical protein